MKKEAADTASMLRSTYTAWLVQHELFPTMAVQQTQHVDAVACRTYFSHLISMFAVDSGILIPSGSIQICSRCIAPICTPRLRACTGANSIGHSRGNLQSPRHYHSRFHFVCDWPHAGWRHCQRLDVTQWIVTILPQYEGP